MLMKLEFTRLHFHPSVVQILSQGDSKLHTLTLASLLYCCVSLSLSLSLLHLSVCHSYDSYASVKPMTHGAVILHRSVCHSVAVCLML